jgi:hypothetical protein
MQRLVWGGVKVKGRGASGKSLGEIKRAKEQEKMQRIRLRETRDKRGIVEGKRENSLETDREKTKLQREKENSLERAKEQVQMQSGNE